MFSLNIVCSLDLHTSTFDLSVTLTVIFPVDWQLTSRLDAIHVERLIGTRDLLGELALVSS